jgi:hypothetical protein
MNEAARLRSQAQRCRRLAENVSTDQDQAMFRRVAKDFDESADELEKKTSQPPLRSARIADIGGMPAFERERLG